MSFSGNLEESGDQQPREAVFDDKQRVVMAAIAVEVKVVKDIIK